MAVVGWVVAVVEVVVGRHLGHTRGVGRMLGDARALPECEVKPPDCATFQVHSSG